MTRDHLRPSMPEGKVVFLICLIFDPDLARVALQDEYARREDANLASEYRITEGFIFASRA